VHVRLHGTGEKRVLSADVLVIATGSAYPLAKPTQAVAGSGTSTAAARAAELAALASRLALARHVLVVGGGPVGVELAAELVCTPPKTRSVTLLSSAPDLLVGMHPSLGIAATQWLTARGVTLVLGDRVPGLDVSARAPERTDERDVVTAAGRVLTVDCVLPAVGMSASTAWAASAPDMSPASSLASAMDGRGKLRVQRTGEVEGLEGRAIFALGDCASHPHQEADLAHTAEKQGSVVAANVWATLRGRGRALREYPHPASFTPPVIFAVSLGPHAALMDFNGRILLTDAYAAQRLAGLAKGAIQALQVSLMRGHTLGARLWDVADACSEWTGWLLPPVAAPAAGLAARPPAMPEQRVQAPLAAPPLTPAGERSRRRSTTGAAFA
jgi:NADH dehydrogenase FAD-containing subunit